MKKINSYIKKLQNKARNIIAVIPKPKGTFSQDNFTFHIVGAGRGGTSLLMGLLDYHSQLEVGYELHSIDYLMGAKLPYNGPDLLNKRVSAYLDACRNEAKLYPEKIWGNKLTTEQICGLEDQNTIHPTSKIDVLDQFFNKRMSDKKVIFILRDGRACINSKIKRTGQPIETACERWKYSVQCYRFFQTQHNNNICIRFEDLLSEPEKTLLKVCTFLQIPYEQEMLKGTKNKKMLPEYQKDTIDTSKVVPITCPKEVNIIIHDDMKYCGYL